MKGEKKQNSIKKAAQYSITYAEVHVTFYLGKESGFKKNISFDSIYNEEWGMRVK